MLSLVSVPAKSVNILKKMGSSARSHFSFVLIAGTLSPAQPLARDSGFRLFSYYFLIKIFDFNQEGIA